MDAYGKSCPDQGGNELRLPATGRSLPSRELDTVRAIEDNHGPQAAQDGDRFKINHQVVVAKRRPPLCDQHIPCAYSSSFLDSMSGIPGSQERTFLDVDGPSCCRCTGNQIGFVDKERQGPG